MPLSYPSKRQPPQRNSSSSTLSSHGCSDGRWWEAKILQSWPLTDYGINDVSTPNPPLNGPNASLPGAKPGESPTLSSCSAAEKLRSLVKKKCLLLCRVSPPTSGRISGRNARSAGWQFAAVVSPKQETSFTRIARTHLPFVGKESTRKHSEITHEISPNVWHQKFLMDWLTAMTTGLSKRETAIRWCEREETVRYFCIEPVYLEQIWWKAKRTHWVLSGRIDRRSGTKSNRAISTLAAPIIRFISEITINHPMQR